MGLPTNIKNLLAGNVVESKQRRRCFCFRLRFNAQQVAETGGAFFRLPVPALDVGQRQAVTALLQLQ